MVFTFFKCWKKSKEKEYLVTCENKSQVFSANKVLLEHSSSHSFANCLWLPLHLNNRVEELRQRLYCPQCWNYLPSSPLKKLESLLENIIVAVHPISWDPWDSPYGRNCWWCASNPWTKYRHPLRCLLAIWNVSMLCMRYNLNDKSLK